MSYSASELADKLEMGEPQLSDRIFKTRSKKNHFRKIHYDNELNRDIVSMMYRHAFEEMMLEKDNSHMHPDCRFRNYDWNAMYEEDARCEDRNYIPKLKNRLSKECSCPDHKK